MIVNMGVTCVTAGQCLTADTSRARNSFARVHDNLEIPQNTVLRRLGESSLVHTYEICMCRKRHDASTSTVAVVYNGKFPSATRLGENFFFDDALPCNETQLAPHLIIPDDLSFL